MANEVEIVARFADLPEAPEELAAEDAAAVRLRKRRVGLVSLLILLLPTLVAVLLSWLD
ncbi:MAG TPA: hypothetical protein VLA66_09640 [Thermoanaerobaculia bacterium]|nr:hypothetical protein [Thermoanaerobaculia bacterium]